MDDASFYPDVRSPFKYLLILTLLLLPTTWMIVRSRIHLINISVNKLSQIDTCTVYIQTFFLFFLSITFDWIIWRIQLSNLTTLCHLFINFSHTLTSAVSLWQFFQELAIEENDLVAWSNLPPCIFKKKDV